MKRFLLLGIAISLFFFMASGASSRSQLDDTTKYLRRNVVLRKAIFQNKELNVLLKELHLTVKSYTIIRGSKPGVSPQCIQLFFEDSNVISAKIHKLIAHPFISIYFENEIDRKEAWKNFYNGNGKWLIAEKDFYGKMIVKDI